MSDNEKMNNEINEESVPDTASENEENVSSNDSEAVDIERNAKEYFNNNYSKSIEEQIKNIHANAMNSYAKESDGDEGSKVLVQGSLEDGNEVVINEEELKSDATKTRDYNMSQLLVLLGKNKDSDKNTTDEDLYEVTFEGKKKKGRKNDDSDEESETKEPVHDTVNEYKHDFEYTEKVQGSQYFKDLRKSAVVASVMAVLTFIATLFCYWIEIGHGAGLPFSHMMQAGRYGRIYVLASLQCLMLCAFFNIDGLLRGIRKMSPKKPAPESVAAGITVVCVLHTVYSAISAYESISLQTFCFFGCVALLVLSLNTLIKAYTRFKSFSLILSKKNKTITKPVEGASNEAAAFSKYLSEESEILRITKTDMVEDFASRVYTVPKATSAANVFMYIALAVSVVIGIFAFVLQQKTLYEAITSAVFIFAFSAPLGFLLTTAFPYFLSSVKLSKSHSAILGEAAPDTYENADVISFDDTEVFPPKAVKITSVNTYNEHRIDKVIVYMAKIFDKVEGPLSYIFSSTIQEQGQNDDEVMLIETSGEGLHLKIGEDDVLVGTGNYLRMYDIQTPADNIDETELRSLTSILWLACNKQLAAKFYIKYTLNKNFEKLLKGLYDAGICCGVRTSDPGINNQLITGNLKGANYPISVITKETKEIGKVEESASGGVVSLSGIHNYLKSFISCSKLRSTYRTNKVIAILSSILGIALSGLCVLMSSNVSPIIAVLFQILWMIPQILFSIFGR